MSKINATPVWNASMEQQLAELKAQKNAAVRDRLAVRDALDGIMQMSTGALMLLTQPHIAERVVQALLPYTTGALRERLQPRQDSVHAIACEARAATLNEVDKALQPLVDLVERATNPWLSGEEHHESVARIRSARLALAGALVKAKVDLASLRKTTTPTPSMPAAEPKVVGTVGGVDFYCEGELQAAEQLAVFVTLSVYAERGKDTQRVIHVLPPDCSHNVRQAVRNVAAELERTTGLAVRIE